MFGFINFLDSTLYINPKCVTTSPAVVRSLAPGNHERKREEREASVARGD